MALVTTTASLIRQYNAFTGLSATERSQSGIARAEVVYYNVNDSWPGAGGSDRRLYQTGQLDLPKDFGYVLTDATLLLHNDSGTDGEKITAEAVAQLRIFPGGILGPQINCTLDSPGGRSDGSSSTAIGSIQAAAYNAYFPSFNGQEAHMVYKLIDKPTALIYPFGSNSYTSTPNPASVFELCLGDQKLGGPAHKISLYIRFLQYDIDQSFNYVVQSPQLTR